MRRKDRLLSNEEAFGIIDACEYAVISCLDEKGEIFSVPISIVRDGMSLYIHGAKGGSKKRLFQNAHNVSVVCVSYNKVPTYTKEEINKMKDNHQALAAKVFTTEYKSAIAQTKAYEIIDEKTKIHALKLLCEKYTPEYMDTFETAAYGSLQVTNIYEFVIQNVSAKAKIIT